MYEKDCSYCGKNFPAKKKTQEFCSIECRKQRDYKIKEEKLSKLGIEGQDYIICRWCDMKVTLTVSDLLLFSSGL